MKYFEICGANVRTIKFLKHAVNSNTETESIDRDFVEALTSLGRHVFNLKVLEFDRISISDTEAVAVINALHKLESLTCCAGKSLTATGIQVMARYAPALKEIVLKNVDGAAEAGLLAVGRYCKHLQKFSLPGYKGTESALIRALALMHNLKHLSLCYASTEIVQSIADNLPSLVTLEIDIAVNLKDTDLELLSMHCLHLRHLTLWDCSRVTLEGLAHLRNLETLCLSGNDHVEDDIVEMLARNHPYLTKLELNGFSQLTEDVVWALLHDCPALCSLDISDNEEDETAEGLISLAQKLLRRAYPRLQTAVCG